MAHILVPLDGSTLAERALPWAATVARATAGHITLVQAISYPTMPADVVQPVDELEVATSDYLKDQAARVQRTYGVTADVVTTFGATASVILAEASARDVDYIAMSTHARDGLGRAVLGSVAEHVLRESPVPVYLLPAAARGIELGAVKRIVMPVDGSELSEAILEPAALLARQLAATITLVRVLEPPEGPVFDEHGVMLRSVDRELEDMQLAAERYMTPLIRRLKQLGVEAHDRSELADDVATEIVRLGDAAAGDLIIMATHGRSGLDRLRHGSVTEQVLRHSHVPLLAFGRLALHSLVAASERTNSDPAAITEPVRVDPIVLRAFSNPAR